MLRHIFRKEGSLRSLLSLPMSCAIYGELWKGLEKSWGLGGPVVPWDGAGHLCPAFEDKRLPPLLGDGEGTGKLGVLKSTGSQRAGHDSVT